MGGWYRFSVNLEVPSGMQKLDLNGNRTMAIPTTAERAVEEWTRTWSTCGIPAVSGFWRGADYFHDDDAVSRTWFPVFGRSSCVRYSRL